MKEPSYARRRKKSHLDTILFEIEMLKFCKRKVIQWDTLEEKEGWVYLEGFLLHYRNLIRFFSGKDPQREGDLSTRNSMVWGHRDLSPAEESTIKDPAKVLDCKYHTDISKYLQHCTSARADRDRGWDVKVMFTEINPIITAFEQAFRKNRKMTRD